MANSSLLINQGTNAAVNFDLNNGTNTQVIGVGYGTISTIGTLPPLQGGTVGLATVVGNVPSGSIDSGNPITIGGVFNNTIPAFTSGQRAVAQFDVNGNQRVVVVNQIGNTFQFNASVTGGFTPFQLVSAASTNATVINPNHTQLGGYSIANTTGTVEYVKLYDSTATPSVGTATPVITLAVPPNASINSLSPLGVQFNSGLGVATTKEAAATGTTAVGSADLIINLFYSGIGTAAQPLSPTQLNNLTYRSVDTMKKNKDTIAAQVSDAVKSDLTTRLSTMNLTHIAVAMPMDYTADYVLHSTTPSPDSAELHIKKWFDQIHSLNLKVLYRGTWCAIENIYNFPFAVFGGTAGLPQGSLASAPTDGTSTWLGKQFGFFHQMPYIWNNGDIFGGIPEPTGNAFNGNWFLDASNGPGTFANFFNNLYGLTGSVLNGQNAGTNLITNPSFEGSSSTGWTVGTSFVVGTNISAPYNNGTNYGTCAIIDASPAGDTTSLISNGCVVGTGQVFTASCFVKTNQASGLYPQMQVLAGSATGTIIGTTNTVISSQGVWRRMWITGTTDVNTGTVFIKILNQSGIGTHNFDAFQVEKNTLTQYFDGSAPGGGVSWSGSPNNSTSTRTLLSQSRGVIAGVTSNNYSEVRSGYIPTSVFTTPNIIAYDYYGNYNGDGQAPATYVSDLQTVYSAKGNVPVFHEEYADLYTANFAQQDRINYIFSFYQAYGAIAGGALTGFNYWGGWEGGGGGESIVYLDNTGHYQLNGRGKLLGQFYQGSAPAVPPLVDVNGNY